MCDPYLKCPVFENNRFLLRRVREEDTADLLLTYSDTRAVPYFNSDNCNGDTFFYTSLSRMQQAIHFWLREYNERVYVRWAILDKKLCQAVGTIELFNRKAHDYFNDCGLLRLDLRSDYETYADILNILALIVPSAFSLFHCKMLATKIPCFAHDRIRAATKLGFIPSDEKLIGGHDGTVYGDYYTLHPQNNII